MVMTSVRRGDMFWVTSIFPTPTGVNKRRSRPAIVISNNVANNKSKSVTVVYAKQGEENHYPFHIFLDKDDWCALCETVTTVSKDRLSDYICTLSEHDMRVIEHGLSIHLGTVEKKGC